MKNTLIIINHKNVFRPNLDCTLDEWLDILEPTFGVVKYEKPTHFFDGRMVQTHYQLLNTLQMTYEEVENHS